MKPLSTRPTRGAVLITGLIVLAVMTILGISSMRGTLLEERMAGNLREHNSAFQAAEAGLQAALTYVEGLDSPPLVDASGTEKVWPACLVAHADVDCSTTSDPDPCCLLDQALGNWERDTAPTAGVRIDGFGGDGLGGIPDASQPRVIIEERYVPPLDFEAAAQKRGVHYYTATAVGIGPAGQSRSVVQATIAKVFAW